MVKKNEMEWRKRAIAGMYQLMMNENVDKDKLAVIGYCFGGSTAQLMAYAAPKGLKAAVSFHGAPVIPTEEQAAKVKAKILMCNGEDDAFIKEDTIKKFKSALDAAKVDYKFINYKGAVHSFTVPEADKLNIKGMAYNKDADQQSWAEMTKLFKEVFAQK
jgi:dienelactone hydrolase